LLSETEDENAEERDLITSSRNEATTGDLGSTEKERCQLVGSGIAQGGGGKKRKVLWARWGGRYGVVSYNLDTKSQFT